MAFCVFDTDMDYNKNKIINKAKQYAKERNIKIITSTPCIELWFLLHYEYTTANLALGTFKNEDQSLNTGAISFTDHDLVGKKVTKVIISADKDIAYQNPTFNLMEGKINGEPSSIEVITDLEIVTATFGAIETSDPVRFVVACSIDDLKNTTFTFDAYIENDIYTCSARPKVTEISGFTIVSFEDLLNMVKK